MIPSCSLDIQNNVYISRQFVGTFSDQWFALPRRFAAVFMRNMSNTLHTRCRHNEAYIVKVKSFEDDIFHHLKTWAAQQKIRIVPIFAPRMLSRENHVEHPDVADKCHRFLRFADVAACKEMVYGEHRLSSQPFCHSPVDSYPSLPTNLSDAIAGVIANTTYGSTQVDDQIPFGALEHTDSVVDKTSGASAEHSSSPSAQKPREVSRPARPVVGGPKRLPRPRKANRGS